MLEGFPVVFVAEELGVEVKSDVVLDHDGGDGAAGGGVLGELGELELDGGGVPFADELGKECAEGGGVELFDDVGA